MKWLMLFTATLASTPAPATDPDPNAPFLETVAEAETEFGIPTGMYVFLIRQALIDLYYDQECVPSAAIDQRYKRAVGAFQRRLGNPPTGVLTVQEFDKLQMAHEQAVPEWPAPGMLHSVGIRSDYAQATGTWRFRGPAKLADPIQASKIECYRELGVCIEAIAVADYGQMLMGGMSHYVRADLTVWKITRWESGVEIVAEDDSAMCVSTTLTLTARNKQATQFRRGKGGVGCRGIAESPQVLELVGFSEASGAAAALAENARSLRNPAAQAELESMFKRLKRKGMGRGQ